MAQAGRMALTLVLALVLLALLGHKFLQAQCLNAELRARVTDDQANFIAAAATAIGFGDPRGLNEAAIEDFIAAERAEWRAGVIKTLLAADL